MEACCVMSERAFRLLHSFSDEETDLIPSKLNRNAEALLMFLAGKITEGSVSDKASGEKEPCPRFRQMDDWTEEGSLLFENAWRISSEESGIQHDEKTSK